MEHDDWDDDGAYPPAPLPAHERAWRHPSEIGSEQWGRTEPPLALGRGLAITTGTLGIALATALMLTMLPTGAGRDQGVAVRGSTDVAAGTGGDFGSVTDQMGGRTDAAVGAPGSSAAPTDTDVGVEVTHASSGAVITSVASSFTGSRPLPTFGVAPSTETEPAAVVVALHDGHLVVTTANAVRANSVELLTPDGGLQRADVLFLDTLSGLAVLAVDAGSVAEPFLVAADVRVGDTVTVLGQHSTTVTVAPTGLIGTGCGHADVVAEGTPVVNSDGALVALCTHDGDSSRMVSLADLDGLRRALGSALPPTVWMGVVLNDDPSGDLVVGALEPDGPAAAAGLDVGDTIIALEGEPVTDLEELAGLLALHQPGDIVEVTVACADGTAMAVLLQLAAPKTAV